MFIMTIVMLASCGPSIDYESTVTLGDEWSYDEHMTYVVPVTDTSQLYDLELILRHSDAFTYQNLYVNINTTYPDGTNISDVVSLQLADRLGQFSGKCSGHVCQVSIVLQEAFRFRSAGEHTITIDQHSRESELRGIERGTLRLVQHTIIKE